MSISLAEGDAHFNKDYSSTPQTYDASREKMFTLLDLCVSSLRRGHANLLCIVPSLTDDPRRESTPQTYDKKLLDKKSWVKNHSFWDPNLMHHVKNPCADLNTFLGQDGKPAIRRFLNSRLGCIVR